MILNKIPSILNVLIKYVHWAGHTI